MPIPDAPGPATAGRPPRRSRRLLGAALLVLGVVALTGLAWAAAALLQLRTHAEAAAGHVAEVQRAVDERDTNGALVAARAASGDTALAQDAASALPLRLLSHLPVSGRLVTDLRSLVAATDLAVGDGAVPLLEVVAEVQSPEALVVDGAVDVEQLRAAAATVAGAAEALRSARDQVEPLDPATFPEQVRGGVSSAREGIGALADAADAADAGLAVLPAALGADGPREYLVVFQNPAEARPTGGLVGTWALVAVDGGRTSLTGVGSNDELVDVRGSAAGLSPELQALYGTGDVRLQNVNLSPDFAVAGQLLSQMWTALGRPAPDGVVALDPQGLAPLLRGKGDLVVPGGPPVNADTVVDVLLSQVYADFADDNQARKRYLSTVVGTAFADALGGGAFDAEVVGSLLEAGREGHLLAWSPAAQEQAALVRAGLSGTLPEPAAGATAVYLTNVDASKLDYYLAGTVTTVPDCSAGAASGAEQLSLALTNDAPESVPEYVDNKLPGRAETTHTTQVALYLPPGRQLQGVVVDGAPVATSAGTEAGWSWLRTDVDVPRGATVTLTAQLTGGSVTSDVVGQPLVRALEVDLGRC